MHPEGGQTTEAPRVRARSRAVGLVMAAILFVGGCASGDGSGGGGDATSSPAGSASSVAAAGPTPSEPPLRPAEERCAGIPIATTTRPVVHAAGGSFVSGLEAGSGNTVVLLVHGSGSRGLCVWAKELPWLAAAGHRVLAVDLPCVGNSPCPAGPPKPLAALTDVVTHLTEAAPKAKVVVIAASAGGPIAVHLASRADSGITAAVALSPAGIEGVVDEGEMKVSTPEAADSVRVPTLVVTDPDDTSVDAATISRLATDPPAALTVEALPAGSGHAQEVLYDTQNPTRASAFRARLLAFLESAG